MKWKQEMMQQRREVKWQAKNLNVKTPRGEGMGLNQGLFTHCVAVGLSKRNADSNQDKLISITELQRYVINSVSTLSKGLQTPTSRAENTVNNFMIW